MTVHFRYIIVGLLSFLALHVGSPLVANAEEPLRTRTYYIDFKPTLVPDKRVEEIIITGLINQGAYRVVRDVLPPFSLVTPEADLIVRNNELKVKAEFAPITGGSFSDDLLLARIGTPTFDTIRIRMTATAYYIDRKEALEFGRVVIGDTAKRRLYVRRDATGDQSWIVVPSTKPEAPFSLRAVVPTNIPTTDTSFFLFEFAPLVRGSYHDTVNLVRMHKGVSLDTVRVFLSGIGFDLDTVVTINYNTVLTADSVARNRAFNKPFAYKYRVVQKPDATSAFSLQIDEEIESVNTTIAFEPLQTKVYNDTVILERVRELQAPLAFDRIVVYLEGVGIGMDESKKVEIDDVVVNDVKKETLTLRLPATPQTTFYGYELKQVDVGPVTGMITEPVQLSKSTSISVEFTCAPTVFANTIQKFVLIRNTEGRSNIDTTQIIVTTEMVPRPVLLSVKMEQDTTFMRIGDTATVRLIVVAQGDIDTPMRVESAAGRIGYNASVIVPLLSDTWTRTREDDDMFVQYLSDVASNVVIEGPTTVLAELQIVGVLGDADKTQLDLNEWILSIDSKRVVVPSPDAHVQLTNIWQYSNGGMRLVNSLQGPLVMDIDPNPVTSTATLSVDNVPADVGELVIVDVNGSIISDLTPQLRAGAREFTITKSAGGSVVVGPGSYYARLLVRGISGETVNSIARLFVVQ